MSNPRKQKFAREAQGSSAQQRFDALKKRRNDERATAIANGSFADPDRPRSLADAITPVGTCQDKCPDFERLERITQNDVWEAEKDPVDRRKPDESRMVKKFKRAAAGTGEQLPSDLRPPQTLRLTCDYLFNELLTDYDSLSKYHHFIWDRTRAVRNDFSIQQVSKISDVRIAIDCFERIARFLILSLHYFTQQEKTYDGYTAQQDREQLDKTLLSLMQYYDDSRARLQSPNEAEFRAYCIIFQIQVRVPDLEDRVQTWPRHIIQDSRVQKALQLYAAACTTNDAEGPLRPAASHPTAQANWARWWRLVASNEISYLMSCVAETYFTRIRHAALGAIFTAYKIPKKKKSEWSQQDLIRALGFEGEDDPNKAVADFCRAYEFDFFMEDGAKYVDLNSVAGKRLVGPATSLKPGFNWTVEEKRHGRTLSAVISGMSVKQARETSQIRDEPGRPSQSQRGDALFWSDADIKVKDAGVRQNKSLAQVNLARKPQQQTIFNFGTPNKAPEVKPVENAKSSNPFAGATAALASTKAPFTFGTGKSAIELPDSPNRSPKPPFTFGAGGLVAQTTSIPPASTKTPFTVGFGGLTNQTASVPPASTNQPFTFGVGCSNTQTTSATPASTKSPSTFGIGGSTAPPASPKSPFVLGIGGSTAQTPSAPPVADPSPKTSEAEALEVKTIVNKSLVKTDSAQTAQPSSQTALANPIAELRGRPPESSQTNQQLATSQTPAGPPVLPPKGPPPEQLEAQKRRAEADLKAKCKIRDSQTLDQLARELVLGSYGFLDQYIEYTAPRIITAIREQVQNSKVLQQADQFRHTKLVTRYGLKWKEIPWKKRLAAQGKSRRQRLRADKEEKERWSREVSVSATTQEFRKSMGASSSQLSMKSVQQDEPKGSSQTSRKAAQATSVDAFGNSMLSIPPSSPQPQQPKQTEKSAHQGHRRTESAPGRSIRLAGLRSVRQNPPNGSSRLRYSFLPGDSFDDAASTAASSVRADTTRSTYFKLKAVGLTPPPVAKRRRRDSGGSLMSRPGKRLTTSVSPVQASISSEQTKEKPQQPHTLKAIATNEEDEELFAQIRQVRDAMSDSMTFFQEERKKDENFRLSQSSAGSAGTPPSSDKQSTAVRDWKAIAEERINKALRASTVTPTTSYEKMREPPPAYRNRISKFLPRERYADKMMAQRPDVGDRRKYVPNRSRKFERKQQQPEEEVSLPVVKETIQDAQASPSCYQQAESRGERESSTLGTKLEPQRQQYSQLEAPDLQSHGQPGMWGSVDPALFTGRNTFLFDTPPAAQPQELQTKQATSKQASAPATDFSQFLEIPSSPPQQPTQPAKSALSPVMEAASPVKQASPPVKEATLPNSKEDIFTHESSFYNGINGPRTASQWPLDMSSSSFGASTGIDNTFGKAMAAANKTVTDMLASSIGQPPKSSSDTTTAPLSKPQTGASTSSFGLFGQTFSNSNSFLAGFGQLSNSKPSVGFSFGPPASKVPLQTQAERIEESQQIHESSVAPAAIRASPSQEAKQQASLAESASYQVIGLVEPDEEDQDAGSTTEFDSSRHQSRENAGPRLTLAKPSPPTLKRHSSELENQPPRKSQRVVSANRFDLLADLAEKSDAESLVSQPREHSEAPSETFDTAPRVQQNHEYEHEHQHRRTSIELTAVDAQKYLERDTSEGEEAPGFGEDLVALDAFNASHAARRNTSSVSQSGFEYEEEFDEEDGFDEDGSDLASLSREAFARYHSDQVEEDEEDEGELTPQESSAARCHQQFAHHAQRQAQMGLDDGLEYEDEDEEDNPEADDGLGYSDEQELDGPIGGEDEFEEDGSRADDDDESEEEDGDEDEEEHETDSSRTSPPAKKREPSGFSSRRQKSQSQQPSQLINGKGGTSAEDAIEL